MDSKSVDVTHPHLVKEWDDERNIKNFTYGSNKKVWWKCKNNHHWQSVVKNRTKKNNPRGCPYCCNQKIIRENSLGYLFPQLISEWDDEKNIFEVAPRSSKKAKWKCVKGHKWKTRINHRTGLSTGCPYCCNRFVSKENSLGSRFPHLIPEWDDERDIFTFAPNSNKKVKWKCRRGHKWETNISHRTSKEKLHGCPYCRESKLEKEMVRILTNLNLHFTRQKKFKDCKGDVSLLSFDFLVSIPVKILDHERGIVLHVEILIEMDGEQHFKPSKYFGGEEKFAKTQKYDKIKNDYCEKNKIPLLRIRYDENVFEKFDDFLYKFITSYN